MANYGFTVPQSGYDDGDRLKAWDRADGNKSQSWNLSLVGDWSSQTENGTTTTRTHGPTHTLTAVGSQPVLSDSRGNLTQPGDGRTFSYDLDRMLSSVTVAANAPGIEGTHTYTFDALGRRVSKIVAPTGGTSSTLVFVHSGHQIVAEYSQGQVATNPLRKYAFGSYIDEPVALIDHTGAASGTGTGANNGTTTVYHYHANHLYSVAALTDQSGQVVERYTYDAYGQQVILDGAATTLRQASLYHNRFTYTGREWDAESATYHYRARTYDARLARFLQRDPIGYRGGLNLSAYVGGQSLTSTDPLGLYPPIELIGPEPHSEWPRSVPPTKIDPYAPWYNNDWTDWVNPCAFGAARGNGIGGAAWPDPALTQQIQDAVRDKLAAQASEIGPVADEMSIDRIEQIKGVRTLCFYSPFQRVLTPLICLQGSIDADTAVRTKASQCGVPIKVLSPDDYGFPKRQDDLPKILPRLPPPPK